MALGAAVMPALRTLGTGLAKTMGFHGGFPSKIVYPMFGLAAASPIVGYELEQRTKAKEEEAEKKRKRKQATGLEPKTAALRNLEILRGVLRQVKTAEYLSRCRMDGSTDVTAEARLRRLSVLRDAARNGTLGT